MPHRSLSLLAVAAVLSFGGPAPAPAEVPPEATTAVAEPTVGDNEFLPEDAALSDCISAVPRPGCGSEARGGWRQSLVFGMVVLALGFVAWRIVVGARRTRQPEPDDRVSG